MENTHQYEVNFEWTQDRKGIISSPVLNQKIEIVTPPDFPKGEPNIWSSEHLFVAAISSCVMNTFFAIADNSELEYESIKCNAIGIVEKIDEMYTVTEIKLKPILTIADAEDSDKALRVLEMSEKNCLISNSVKSNIVVESEIVVTA
ncbi:peroxiredoxin, SACOL1771 subfamily [Flavobacterium micromati]|jgi:peroxiredoxin-like protein|uniref:Peroxiredoxin, SACOL1771 subfamily n=1 Tax=Flavobacterium micromati TaxID=229205 RepID=A0A1M5P776_9FLAO|nr:OsmC family protein [Flavobacterium micromati]MCL6461679.1 OsmC family protein [Flavobacterium micromati]SHG97608.1 peroxiredoxin, SACOL1771 subfamily [Flavobacterium micromati]